MPEFTGKNMYIKFCDTALSSRYKSFDETEEANLAERTAGSDANELYLVTTKDGSASLELLAEEGGTALWAAVAPGLEGTLEWGEEGTASGKPKHLVNAIIKNRKKNVVHKDVVKINVEFQFSGAVSDTTY